MIEMEQIIVGLNKHCEKKKKIAHPFPRFTCIQGNKKLKYNN